MIGPIIEADPEQRKRVDIAVQKMKQAIDEISEIAGHPVGNVSIDYRVKPIYSNLIEGGIEGYESTGLTLGARIEFSLYNK